MKVTDALVLVLDHVAVGYGRQVVLQEANLRLARGSFTGLVGANGSGKSTLLKTILNILPPLAGQMKFVPIEGRLPVLGYMPQRESLDPIYLLSSFEVVLMGVCGRVGPGRLIGKTEREWARQCLAETGAAELGRKLFSELSGGQKQRVLLARALATKADFFLLDEPTAGIDAATTQPILELLRKIHAEGGRTILMASHDLATVRQYAQQALWLHQGQLLQGRAVDLLSRQSIEQIMDVELH
jgi:ABC-type Mn2+/Zn2+ transport system ATPase subunit